LTSAAVVQMPGAFACSCALSCRIPLQILSELFYHALSDARKSQSSDEPLLQSLRSAFKSGAGEEGSDVRRSAILMYFAPKLSAAAAKDRDCAHMALNLLLAYGM
jgi:hypothetical protein